MKLVNVPPASGVHRHPPTATLNPWRQASGRALYPDDQTCRQGACLLPPSPIRSLQPSARTKRKCAIICHLGAIPSIMNMLHRLLVILVNVALLAPALQWGPPRAAAEPCACPPTACSCPGHEHRLGQTPVCAMAHGGTCGLESADASLVARDTSQVFVLTENRLPSPWTLWAILDEAFHRALLPSHAKPLDHPPRLPS